MARVYQVPQHAFVWLMTAAVLACLPHLLSAPLWLQVLVPVLQVWRLLVQRGRLRMPSRWWRGVLLLAVVLATLYSYGTLLGPDAGIAMLVCAYNLKLLEMFRLRDAYIAIVLSYFVLATVLLAHQDFFFSLYVLLALVVVTAALIGINQPEASIRARQQLKYSGALVLQAIPLMIFLFVVVPRVPPLWNLPSQQKGARTGVSDSMAPGEVSELSRSAELAFRVQFDGAVPPPAQRYWRGLTYSWFDGRRWSQAVPRDIDNSRYVVYPGQPRPQWYQQVLQTRQGEHYRYQVMLEPTRRRWLFSLATPFTEAADVGFVRDFRLVSREPVNDLRVYKVDSYTQMPREPVLPAWERRLDLTLPAQGNPRARQQAQQWRLQASSDEAFIRRTLNWYREEKFFYTLEPPPLAGDQIDDFLFRTRAGFCEHYASSFAFMLRAAGIPARIVAGYQGGELNPLGSHLLVHQYDAHAWVEAWLPGRGWQRFDPTFMVAPERIELGLEQALEKQGDSYAAAFSRVVGLSRLGWVRSISNAMDYLQFKWQQMVVSYDSDTQDGLLGRLLGEVSATRVALLIAGGLLVLALPLALVTWWRGRTTGLSWWQREYWALLRDLRRRGVDIPPWRGPQALAQTLARRYPASGPLAHDWARLYAAVAYGANRPDSDGASPAATRQRPQLRRLRRQLVRAIT